uniref:Endoplasmic reticulum transmembrane protein n=1 Tax=Caligus rogercresseyi TaxID=217165 RepID=C1BR31_CALRO|nr:B-cell receptor-associated protein 31 [Caligus rogercresseyi]
MSLHWSLIAGFLYLEIGVIALLLFPFISPRVWNKFFKSKFLKGLENQLVYYFYVVLAILVLFFLDAIREMIKYNDENTMEGHGKGHMDIQMQNHLRLFRSQRNFYISGFSLFLCLVIRRMVSLLSSNSVLQAEKDAAMKQASSASRAAEQMLSGEAVDSELKNMYEETKKELENAKKDVEGMKTQSKNLTEEYDRLMEEKDKLERKVLTMGDKKDD